MNSKALDINGGSLRLIRENLNISKFDFSDSLRELINMIEANKIPLNTDFAQVICESINDILDKRKMDYIIEPEDLFNIGRFQAKEELEVHIEELKKHCDNTDYIIDQDDIEDLEYILDEYDLMDKKIKVYEIIGDIYYNSNNFMKEHEYLSKAWELRTRYPKRKLNYRIMVKLANNHIDRGNYQEAISLFQKALLDVDNIPEEYLIHLYYNYAIAYYRLKMYSIALDLISTLLEYKDDENLDMWMRTYTLQGSCHFGKGDYELALKSYNRALEFSTINGENSIRYSIFGNIAEVYTRQGDQNRAYAYIDGILREVEELNKKTYDYLVITNQLGVSYENLGEFKKAEEYYQESLEYAIINNYKNYAIKNLRALIDLNEKYKVKDIYRLIEKSRDYIMLEIKEKDGLWIILRLLNIYASNGEYEKLQKLIDNILEHYNKI